MKAINHKNIKTEDIKIFTGTLPKEFQPFRDGYFINILPKKVEFEPDEYTLQQYAELGIVYEPEDSYVFYCCFVKAKTQEELEDLKEEMFDTLRKYFKEKALSAIVVETSNGSKFDGDLTSRINMLSAIQASELLGIGTHTWKLSDNSYKEITITELKEALALSIQSAGEIYLLSDILELAEEKGWLYV